MESNLLYPAKLAGNPSSRKSTGPFPIPGVGWVEGVTRASKVSGPLHSWRGPEVL